MMDSAVTWFMLMFGCGYFVAWLLYKLYEYDYKKVHKDENKFDYWG